MNWNGTLHCTHQDQIFLLLKSSDIVSDLIDQQMKKIPEQKPEIVDSMSPFYLVLKKFYSMNPSMEFRCIVKNSKLVGITQRYPNKLYPHLISEKETYKTTIMKFFCEHIESKFPEQNYTFDLFYQNKPWILDFNKLDESSNLGLFVWDDLETIAKETKNYPYFLVIEEESGIILNSDATNRLPFDLKGTEMSTFFQNLKQDKQFGEI